MLRAKAQKADYGYDVYPLVFRFIRFVSIYFTWLLIQTNWKPNTITIIGALMGVLSGILFALNYVGFGLIIATIAIISDFSDGEVSRFQGTSSKEGTYLDNIHHFVVQPFFIAGIVLWGFKINQNIFFLGAGMMCVINSILLPLSISSAVDIAVLKHLLRHVPNEGKISSQENSNSFDLNKKTYKYRKFYRTLPGMIARFMDFPYVIIIMGFSAAITNYIEDPNFFFGLITINYVIYIYALLSTVIICVYVWNVVSSRHIEKRLNEIILSQLK